jgi:hypothetical protein
MKRWLIALTLLAILSTQSWSDEPAKPAKCEDCCKACGLAAKKPAESGCCDAACPKEAGCCAQCAVLSKSGPAKSADEETYEQLAGMVESTQCPDVFVATVTALGSLEGRGKRAMPAVIRTAARLGILKGVSKAETLTPAQEVVMDFLSGCPSRDEAAPTPPVAYRLRAAPGMPVPFDVLQQAPLTCLPLPPRFVPSPAPAPPDEMNLTGRGEALKKGPNKD